MPKLIRAIFLVADVVIVASAVLAIALLVRSTIGLLNITIGAEAATVNDGAVLNAVGLFALNLMVICVNFFGYYLLVRRQVFGLLIVFAVAVVGFFLSQDQVYLPIKSLQLTIISLPWLLIYIDMKRRGIRAP